MVPLLELRDLSVRFAAPGGEVAAVRGLDLSVAEGLCLGIVGESGAGKSQIFLAVMGLLARNGAASGSVRFRGAELLGAPAAELNRVRGRHMAMVFQDPMTSLNPYLKISRQMTEVLVIHKGLDEGAARVAALGMLDRVRIPDARRRFDTYPHEFSGGMRQRVMIAMALLAEPELLIADEPTTALDVTVQAEIVDLLAELRAAANTAIVLITHDLAVIAGLAERVAVVYAGRIVEEGSAEDIFYDPQHPYTRGLLEAMPRLDGAAAGDLDTIPGAPPDPLSLPPGCAFQGRCAWRLPECAVERPVLRPAGPERRKACHLERLAP
jgi:oligopeptide transport system ATP-binding protein